MMNNNAWDLCLNVTKVCLSQLSQSYLQAQAVKKNPTIWASVWADESVRHLDRKCGYFCGALVLFPFCPEFAASPTDVVG